MLARRGTKVDVTAQSRLREIGFRSLDFSELALRLEQRTGQELVINADAVRRIESIQDVLDFFESAFHEE